MEIFGQNGAASPWVPDVTGRYLVVLDEAEFDAEMGVLDAEFGGAVARASELGAADEPVQMSGSVVFESIGVAVVDAEPARMEAFAATATARRIVEPERYVYALTTSVLEAPVAAWDPKLSTWGLQATGVVDSPLSGKGVKVAVLDTGFDLNHPDFAGRTVVGQSFIAGEAVQDGHGHGTHCVGTSCGPRTPAGGVPRYGVAYNAEIYVGKVLSNAGSGSDAGILAGIDWAIRNGCRIVSMSLGAPASGPNDPYSQVYETVARRAAARGTLIIAAAGNESATVGHPANCPSIMAVGALDSTLQRAGFSNATGDRDGAQVDIAGPGVDVWSSWPMPKRYRSISGTSMATPHVAGIAALFAEAEPTATPMALWGRLAARSRRLGLPSTQVGSGLVQAR